MEREPRHMSESLGLKKGAWLPAADFSLNSYMLFMFSEITTNIY